MLANKVGFVTGLASKHSIASAVAKAWHQHGATVVIGVQSDRFVGTAEKLATSWGISQPNIVTCDVTCDDSVAAAMHAVAATSGGKLDALLHSVAFAPTPAMKDSFLNTSRDHFRVAMDVSAYSLVALAREALPLFHTAGGGSITSMSYIGARSVVPHYNVMGPAKAALEACTRTLAAELGCDQVRVNAISAGPLNTLAARGIANFTAMREAAERAAPLQPPLSVGDVADMATFLASDMSRSVTGQVLHVDSGASIMGSVQP